MSYFKVITSGKVCIEWNVCACAEAMPGSIRKAENFIGFMRRVIEYLKVCVTGGCDGVSDCVSDGVTCWSWCDQIM